ncbi:hypothetical protein [Nocardia xishanensis]
MYILPPQFGPTEVHAMYLAHNSVPILLPRSTIEQDDQTEQQEQHESAESVKDAPLSPALEYLLSLRPDPRSRTHERDACPRGSLLPHLEYIDGRRPGGNAPATPGWSAMLDTHQSRLVAEAVEG